MKKLQTSNEALIEVLEANGIKTICGENMDILVSDTDAERIQEIVNEMAPVAAMDYSIEEIEIPRVDYKRQILLENYEEYKRIGDESEPISFREYVKAESESDPYFWGWLFDDGYIEECPNEETFAEFMKGLE